jgi:hypothetical protein
MLALKISTVALVNKITRSSMSIEFKEKPKKKKVIIAFLLFIFVFNFSFSQNYLNNNTIIEQKIEFIGLWIKNKKTYKLDSLFTNKQEKKTIQKLTQLFHLLPKGTLSLEKVIQKDKNNYVAISQIKPFGIPVSFYFNNKIELKDVSISNDYNINFSNDFVLEDTILKFPFHLINGYILVEGEVNNIKGKFMFDTGTPFGFMLNKNYTKIKTEEIIHSGSANSGQVFDIYLNTIDTITIANQVFYQDVPNITLADFSFIEKGITSDFLGFIGYEFIKNYEVILDYDHQLITLYKIDSLGNTLMPYKLSNELLTIINTKPDRHLPTALIKFGKTEILGHFDTGNPGTISLNDTTKNKFLQEGILEQFEGKYRHGQILEATDYAYNMNNVNYKGVSLKYLNNFIIDNNEKNHFGFGYQFLKNYLTVWNFTKEEIGLYER